MKRWLLVVALVASVGPLGIAGAQEVPEELESGVSGIACDRSALTPKEWRRHEALTRQLVEGAAEVKELPVGWAFREKADAATMAAIGRWISEERLCCPFIRFALVVEPKGDVAWLKLTGGPGVKELIGQAVVKRQEAQVVPPR